MGLAVGLAVGIAVGIAVDIAAMGEKVDVGGVGALGGLMQ